MKMKSPTNVLNCIKIMKSKLRNDKEQLQLIRKDFGLTSRTLMENKSSKIKNMHLQQSQSGLNGIQSKPEQQNTQQESIIKEFSQYRRSSSIDGKNKLVQIHRRYQQKLRQQQQNHKKQSQKQLKEHRQQIIQLRQKYQFQLKEQAEYIEILSSKHECEQNGQQHQQKYEQIINNLLQENSILVEKLNQLKKQLSHKQNFSNKNSRLSNHQKRLKFNKLNQNLQWNKCYNSTIIKTENINWNQEDKENRQSMNRMNQKSQYSDEIDDDEVKLRSIKGFICLNQENLDIMPTCIQIKENTRKTIHQEDKNNQCPQCIRQIIP